jgi:hypothetical protein
MSSINHNGVLLSSQYSLNINLTVLLHLQTIGAIDKKRITGMKGSQDNGAFQTRDKTMWPLIKLRP